MQTKILVRLMVFDVLERDGKGIPPHFIETGLKLSKGKYLKILIDVLLPWFREITTLTKLCLLKTLRQRMEQQRSGLN